VLVLGHQVNVVDTFVCLSSSTDQNGGCDTDIRRRIGLARSCMRFLDRSIWRTSISLPTTLRLYNIYILPVVLCGADTWSMNVTARWRIDAFDQWCLRHILRIPYTANVLNLTKQSRVTGTILDRRFKLSGQNRPADPSHDHARALQASINRLPEDWRRPSGRPRQSWLRTIEGDLNTQSIGLSSAWHIAHRGSRWYRVGKLPAASDSRSVGDTSQNLYSAWRIFRQCAVYLTNSTVTNRRRSTVYAAPTAVSSASSQGRNFGLKIWGNQNLSPSLPCPLPPPPPFTGVWDQSPQ